MTMDFSLPHYRLIVVYFELQVVHMTIMDFYVFIA